MHSSSLARAAGLALAFVLAADPASATLLPALTLEDLTVRSTDIVEGTVIDRTPRWSRGMLFTDVTIEVQTCLKGACTESTVVVAALGGTDGEVVVEAAGAPTYEDGERVLLFLEPMGGSAGTRLRTAGLSLGKFRIAQAGDLEVVARTVENVTLVGPARHIAFGQDALPLADLRRAIASYLVP